ncbi:MULTISPECIES: hypothetical protein [unclassified Microbacterium]|uniref:hypothetical protein n=1 Tax=unclassified Microbacterium TaxID=2609290 RepID=UPI000EA9E5EB|nr:MULTISPECIES: hypothetical protein [unclassified Microbacterium]MBT2483762.1 hypothetical protein [Microbacterium sp. ISL-108]RKN66751.1 hypothetical protein D7252_03515 [Microbacterium sp. CGR2]
MPAETARRSVRILTWIGIATGVAGGLLVTFPNALPVGGPWVQLALGIATLVLAFRARKVGIAEIPGFDGRLSLLAALLGFLVVFFAGQVAFVLLVAAAGS